MLSKLLKAAFRAMLHLYPRPFLRAHGAEIRDNFARRLEEERSAHGVVAAGWYGIRSSASVVPSAVRVRTDGAHKGVLDLHSVLRSLRRAPGFSVLSVLILGTGVAGSAAVFSVLYGVLLDPLPYADSDRTVVVWTYNTRQGLRDGSSYLNMEDWADRSRTVEEWAYYGRPAFSRRTQILNEEPIRLDVGQVSASFFDVLGVQPVLGRTFSTDEEYAGTTDIVISEALWRDQFGARPDVVGQSIILDERPREILGVMPSTLALPLPTTSVWESHGIGTGWPEDKKSRGLDAFVALGRLAPGASVEEAEAELVAIASDLEDEHPENRDLSVEVASLMSELTGQEIPRTLWLMQIGALLVLLAVVVNVAHLWILRGLDRRADMAVRLSLGASRGRVAGGLFAEGTVLTALATLAGLATAAVLLEPLLPLLPANLPRRDGIALQGPVVGITVVVALAVGMLASGLSAALAVRGSMVSAAWGRQGQSGKRSALRGGFVVTQMAMATTLSIATGLFFQSFNQLRSMDLGMDPEGLLVARVEVGFDRYPDAASVTALHDQVLERVRSTPGIRSAGAISDFAFRRFPDATITPEERVGDTDIPQVPVMTDAVMPGALESMGVRLQSGRLFESGETRPAEGDRPVVVTRSFIEAHWPGASGLGNRFQWGAYHPERPWNAIVGVIDEVQRGNLAEAPPAQVFSLGPSWHISYLIRPAGGTAGEALPALRESLRSVDPGAAIAWARPAGEIVGERFSLWRLRSLMAAGAGGLVAVLALVGMYGLLRESVVRKRFEIGIRMALGAAPQAVRNAVVGRGLRLAAAGVAAGLIAVGLSYRLVQAFLYGVSPFNPVVAVSVTALLMALAAVASWLPARWASDVDPARCLDEA